MDKWAKAAKRINALRVFPRIYVTAFLILYVVLVAESWLWYTALDLKGIDAANLIMITAFPVALITALGKMLSTIYLAYQSYKDTTETEDDVA